MDYCVYEAKKDILRLFKSDCSLSIKDSTIWNFLASNSSIGF